MNGTAKSGTRRNNNVQDIGKSKSEQKEPKTASIKTIEQPEINKNLTVKEVEVNGMKVNKKGKYITTNKAKKNNLINLEEKGCNLG